MLDFLAERCEYCSADFTHLSDRFSDTRQAVRTGVNAFSSEETFLLPNKECY